jgi:type II secretory pathway pseudopilin PulG
MKITQRHGKAAFTLIELMAVITIIFVLAGMVFSGLGFVKYRQAKEKAQVQIALLSKALGDYKLDMGQYPPSEGDSEGTDQTSLLYTALFYEGYQASQKAGSGDKNAASKIYVPELDPVTSKQGWFMEKPSKSAEPPERAKIIDPWGNEYHYRSAKNASGGENVTTQNPDFDLWSAGKDGKTNTSSPKDQVNLDDIKNF